MYKLTYRLSDGHADEVVLDGPGAYAQTERAFAVMRGRSEIVEIAWLHFNRGEWVCDSRIRREGKAWASAKP